MIHYYFTSFLDIESYLKSQITDFQHLTINYI